MEGGVQPYEEYKALRCRIICLHLENMIVTFVGDMSGRRNGNGNAGVMVMVMQG